MSAFLTSQEVVTQDSRRHEGISISEAGGTSGIFSPNAAPPFSGLDGSNEIGVDSSSSTFLAASMYIGRGLAAPVPAALRISAFHSTGVIGSPSSQHLVALAAASVIGGLEHARRMLGLLIRCGQRLVAPYVPVLLRSLLPHAWGYDGRGAVEPLAHLSGLANSGKVSSVVFTSSLLAALGELSAVAPDALVPYVPVLLPQFVDAVLQVCHCCIFLAIHRKPFGLRCNRRVSIH